MNKRTKIGLILVITVILVILSVGLASAATMPVNSSTCWIRWMGFDKDGFDQLYYLIGEAVWSVGDETITKTCTGNIPLGETRFNHYYYDLDEMRAYLWETYGAVVSDPFVIGPEEMGDAQMGTSYKGDDILSSDWTALVESTGDFEYQANFDIP